MKKAILKMLVIVSMATVMLFVFAACGGSRLEGTYQCADPSEANRFIRFSDGKIYKNNDAILTVRLAGSIKLKVITYRNHLLA